MTNFSAVFFAIPSTFSNFAVFSSSVSFEVNTFGYAARITLNLCVANPLSNIFEALINSGNVDFSTSF